MAERFAIAESPSGVGIVAVENYILISNGDGTWRTGPAGGGGGAVDSVFGRTGVVDAVTGDYNSDQVDNNSAVAGASVSNALNTLNTAIAGKVTSVFGRTGVVIAVTGDYAASQVTNDSGVAGTTVKAALDSLNAKSGVTSVFGRTGAVVAVNGDYLASQVTNNSSVTGATVKDALFYVSKSDGIINQSSVDGTNVTAALDALLIEVVNFFDTETPAVMNNSPGSVLGPFPLPVGLYLVTASVTTLTTNTTGVYTTSFGATDAGGTAVVKLCLTTNTAVANTQTGQVILSSDGSQPLRWINAITTPFVGGTPNVKNKISAIRLVSG